MMESAKGAKLVHAYKCDLRSGVSTEIEGHHTESVTESAAWAHLAGFIPPSGLTQMDLGLRAAGCGMERGEAVPIDS